MTDETGYTTEDVKEELEEIVQKVDDLRCFWDKLQSDKKLDGIEIQAKYFLDIMKENDISVYSYHSYNHEVEKLLEGQGEEVVQGMLRVNNFAHQKLSMDEVFDGYPSDEDAEISHSKEMALEGSGYEL